MRFRAVICNSYGKAVSSGWCRGEVVELLFLFVAAVLLSVCLCTNTATTKNDGFLLLCPWLRTHAVYLFLDKKSWCFSTTKSHRKKLRYHGGDQAQAASTSSKQSRRFHHAQNVTPLSGSHRSDANTILPSATCCSSPVPISDLTHPQRQNDPRQTQWAVFRRLV